MNARRTEHPLRAFCSPEVVLPRVAIRTVHLQNNECKIMNIFYKINIFPLIKTKAVHFITIIDRIVTFSYHSTLFKINQQNKNLSKKIQADIAEKLKRQGLALYSTKGKKLFLFTGYKSGNIYLPIPDYSNKA